MPASTRGSRTANMPEAEKTVTNTEKPMQRQVFSGEFIDGTKLLRFLDRKFTAGGYELTLWNDNLILEAKERLNLDEIRSCYISYA